MLEQSEIPDLVARATGATVQTAEALSGSVTNRSWRLETTAGSMALKCCPEQDWRNETTALTAVASSPTIPTARLLAAGHQQSAPWIILEWIDGVPATAAETRRSAGQAIRHLHALVADHFGPSGNPAVSWGDVIHRGLRDEVEDVVAARLLSREQADLVQRAIDDIPAYSGPPRILHGDLKDVHLHTRNNELVAILDWGDATAGDPDYDLARYSIQGPEALRAFMDGYGPVDLPQEALRGYRLRFTLSCMATELRADGDWFSVYQSRMAADL